MSGSVIAKEAKAPESVKCYHCGDHCKPGLIVLDNLDFCCNGCKTVYEILDSNNLCAYYEFESNPGVAQLEAKSNALFDYLDSEPIKKQLLDFASEDYESVTLTIPNIHCSSCIWLLENLTRLNSDILHSKVDFVEKRLTVHYLPKEFSLKNLAELLDAIGYAPVINLDDGEPPSSEKTERSKNKQLIFKLGVAGFCFGNVMLLSFPDYLGLTGIEKTYSNFFRYLNMLLALPVVFYSGSEYLTSALKSIRQRYANIDVPIALGVMALFLRSSYEVISGAGSGYFDSLVGLIFFLLIGKWFQAKSYRTLSFERDYKSYFPLAIQKLVDDVLVSTPVKALEKGDEILVRNNEIIPGDAILIDKEASIDYSFVTGESEPVRRKQGDYIYAGGRQVGSGIRLVIQKKISQSYLTKLWNNEAFSKEKSSLKLVDQISQYFTLTIILLALGGAFYWQLADPSKTWTVFTAVLIVACPCALALSTPFTTGSVTRVFGKNRFYLKNADVAEQMGSIEHVIFDKTGTLTDNNQHQFSFIGELSDADKGIIAMIAGNSTHPLSTEISKSLITHQNSRHLLTGFKEIPGKGLQAEVNGLNIRLGSATFVGIDEPNHGKATRVFVKFGDSFKGYFELKTNYRKGMSSLIQHLKQRFRLSVLSGDNNGEQASLQKIFPKNTQMFFDQAPEDKMNVIKEFQNQGKVMMLGDGLNDAGALMQSEVGIAVTENTSHFSPASDAILEASSLYKLDKFLSLAKSSKKIIMASFVLSVLYNLGGIGFAITGNLTPLIAAILMPLSSISVVVFTTLMVRFSANRLKLN